MVTFVVNIVEIMANLHIKYNFIIKTTKIYFASFVNDKFSLVAENAFLYDFADISQDCFSF